MCCSAGQRSCDHAIRRGGIPEGKAAQGWRAVVIWWVTLTVCQSWGRLEVMLAFEERLFWFWVAVTYCTESSRHHHNLTHSEQRRHFADASILQSTRTAVCVHRFSVMVLRDGDTQYTHMQTCSHISHDFIMALTLSGSFSVSFCVCQRRPECKIFLLKSQPLIGCKNSFRDLIGSHPLNQQGKT